MSVVFSTFGGNGWRYGVVRDYEAISYQFTPTFFKSHEPLKTSETRMHYTVWPVTVAKEKCHFAVTYYYCYSYRLVSNSPFILSFEELLPLRGVGV